MDTSLFRLDEAHLHLLGRGLLGLGLSLIVAMSFLGPVKPAKGMLPGGFTMPMLAIELPTRGGGCGDHRQSFRQGRGCRGTSRERGAPDEERAAIRYGDHSPVREHAGHPRLVALSEPGSGPRADRGRGGGGPRSHGGVARRRGERPDLESDRRCPRCASLDALFTVSLWKWGLLAVAFLLLSGLFALGTRSAAGLAVLCLVTGVLGTIGLKQNLLLEKTMMLMVLTLLVVILLFAFRPGNLLRDLGSSSLPG